jgi:hypothetical protein
MTIAAANRIIGDRRLEPFRKVVESKESDVIHCRAPESKEGARYGSQNTGAQRSAAACDIPVMADVGLDALEAELAPVSRPSWSFRQLLDRIGEFFYRRGAAST